MKSRRASLHATRAGLSFGIDDMVVPPTKHTLVTDDRRRT
jgi:hypothetical protein